MADTKLQKLQRWQVRADAAKTLRTDWETTWHVEALERAFLGKPEESEDVPFWVNLVFPTLLTQKPALLPRTTSWLVKPKAGKKPFDAAEAQMQQGVLSAIAAQDDHLFHDARLALQQAFFRVGVLKTSYDPKMEKNPDAGEVLTDPWATEDAESEPEPKEILTDEVYRWQWVDAARMLLPDQGANPRMWTWIGEEVEVPLRDAKHDPRFRRGLRRQLKANATSKPEDDTSPPRPESANPDVEEDEHAMLRYTEVWDWLEGEHLIWAEGQEFDEFLLDEEMPEGIEDHPYSLLAFVPLLGPKPLGPKPWPVPLTFNWLPIQDQYDILAQMVLNNAKRAARKFLYGEGTFPDEEEMDKFTSPQDMQGVRVDPTQLPVMFGEASTNPDVVQALLFLRNTFREITGATATRVGQPDADTATEAVLAEQSASLRDSDMRLLVDKWLGESGRKMLQLVKETLTLSIWVQFRKFDTEEMAAFLNQPAVMNMLTLQYGPENVQRYIQMLQVNEPLQRAFIEKFGHIKPLEVTRTQLQFEADVEVLPSTSRPLQQTQLLRLASVLGPMAFASPTFLEELLASFDLPQGERIAEEIQIAVRQMQQMQAQQAAQGGSSGGSPGGSGTPGQGNIRRGLRTNGPLASVGGVGGGLA